MPNWKEFRIHRHRCNICGKPFDTKRGRRAHYLACHTNNLIAERNWNICMMFYEGDMSARQIAEFTELSPLSIRRILNNVVMHPFYYELDPVLVPKEPLKMSGNMQVIPINRKMG